MNWCINKAISTIHLLLYFRSIPNCKDFIKFLESERRTTNMKICLLTAHRFYYVIETQHRKSTHQPFSINVPWVAVFYLLTSYYIQFYFFVKLTSQVKVFHTVLEIMQSKICMIILEYGYFEWIQKSEIEKILRVGDWGN